MDHDPQADRVGRVEFSNDPQDRYLHYRQTLALESIAYLLEALLWCMFWASMAYVAGITIEEFLKRRAA